MSRMNLFAAALVALAWLGLGLVAALAQGSPPAETDTTITAKTSNGAEVLPPPVITGQPKDGCVTKPAKAKNEVTGGTGRTAVTTCEN